MAGSDIGVLGAVVSAIDGDSSAGASVPITCQEAKRLANEDLRDSGLVAVQARRHRDAWVVSYVDAERPDEVLDGGPLVVTDDGELLYSGSLPGDVDRVLDRDDLRQRHPHRLAESGGDVVAVGGATGGGDLAESGAEAAPRAPWPGILPEPQEALRKVAMRREEATVYPRTGLELAAMAATPFEDVRVVILGLDPYPNVDHATGLAFSVPLGVSPLPSGLTSIRCALQHDNFDLPASGSLDGWAHQGVLLLNRALTVEMGEGGKPQTGRHLPIWREFTDSVIRAISDRPGPPVVFVLWGRDAQKAERLIDPRHHVIKTWHPSSRGKHKAAFQSYGTFEMVNARVAGASIDWGRD